MDYIGFLMIGVLGVFCGIITTIFAFWRLKKDEFFEQIVENIINNVSNDADLQKNLYNIGGLIGSGAKSGLGIAPTRGKMKIEDIIMQLVGSWADRQIAHPSPPSQTLPPLPMAPKDSFFNP